MTDTSELSQKLLDAPIAPEATKAFADRGFEARLTPGDTDAFGNWIQAVARGFLDSERSEDDVKAISERSAGRRNLGVYDPASPQADVPVGTFASYVVELTVPGGGTVPTQAVTAVTVAATRRRRGIARAMMESELRLGKDLGIPMASLTVSESSIYQRYGYAPAANSAKWVIDRKRALYQGPAGEGSVDFITRETYRELAPKLHDTVRLADPGEITMNDSNWDSVAGTRPDAKEAGKSRAVQYRDASGAVTGLAIYSVTEADDYANSPLTISQFLTATDDAYAGLWHYFFNHDLIGTITIDQRVVDEPLRWMIADQRAATVTVTDHQYVRILDVAACLKARTYSRAGRLVIDVTDPLGLDSGRYALKVDTDGLVTVDAGVTEDADVTLGTVELSALYLGGVSAHTLAAAGRLQTTNAPAVDGMFRTPTDPRLSFWY